MELTEVEKKKIYDLISVLKIFIVNTIEDFKEENKSSLYHTVIVNIIGMYLLNNVKPENYKDILVEIAKDTIYMIKLQDESVPEDPRRTRYRPEMSEGICPEKK